MFKIKARACSRAVNQEIRLNSNDSRKQKEKKTYEEKEEEEKKEEEKKCQKLCEVFGLNRIHFHF